MPAPVIHINEALLLEQTAAGDEKAFRRLFDQYWDRMYSVSYIFTKSAELSEEIVQDIFVKIWQKRDELPSIQNFSNYLYSVAKNHILNTLRRRITDLPFQEDLHEYFKESANQPDEQFLRKESQELIDKATSTLTETQRRVFLLSRQEGLSHDQIAERLGVSKLTVRSHIQSSLKTIREYLQKHSGGAMLVAAIIGLYLD